MNWYNEPDILIMSRNEDKQICICKLMHKPHFRSVTPIMALISRPGVVKLALSDPQGVSEAFQGVYDR